MHVEVHSFILTFPCNHCIVASQLLITIIWGGGESKGGKREGKEDLLKNELIFLFFLQQKDNAF